MKTHNQPIRLSNTQPAERSDRLVKRGARIFFSLLRSTAEQASRVPGILATATADVREAWEETSRPNV